MHICIDDSWHYLPIYNEFDASSLNGTGNGSSSDAAWRDSTAAKSLQPNKILVSAQAIAHVVGRGGQNINASRKASGAHIEVEKQQMGQTDRLITIRGSPDATKQAILMINGLINEPDVSVQEIVSKVKTKDRKTIEALNRARPPSANAILKTQSATSGVGTTTKVNGFPEISVWVPTTTKAGRQHQFHQQTSSTSAAVSNGPRYTTASGNSKAKVSSSKASTTAATLTTRASEYSPLGSGSTLNVWQQRAYLLQQKKRADFASVAATGLGITNVAATANLSSQPSTKSSPGSGSKNQQANPPTPADLSKAPGYRSQGKNATSGSVGGQIFMASTPKRQSDGQFQSQQRGGQSIGGVEFNGVAVVGGRIW